MPLPTANHFAALLESAVSSKSSVLGRAVHAQILKTLLSPLPPFLSTHLVNMYSKLDLPASAHLVLRLSPRRSVVSWSALIAGSVTNGHFSFALFRFSDMLRDQIQPNDFTFPCAFKASAFPRLPSVGKQIHALALKFGRIYDVFVACSAFDMYCKTGLGDDARKMFDEMPHKNVVTWNAYISNAVMDGKPLTALDGFIKFRSVGGEPNYTTYCAFLNACSDTLNLELGRQLHGFVIRYGFEGNVFVSNGLIDFYGKCKEVGLSEMVFSNMDERNDVSWSSMVAAYMQNNEEERACTLFLQSRKQGIEPKDFMVSSVLSACARLAGLGLGRSVHALAVKACVDDNIFVASSLVDMYGKCGSTEDAEQVFREMPERNLITWNAMIGGYAHQGRAPMALSMFKEMTSRSHEMVPNSMTFVSVLSACSRAGAVKVGMEIFESMKEKYGIEPKAEHYASIVDLLGKAGMVECAYKFVKEMPIKPTVEVWGALLNACRVHGKVKLGKTAADKLFELDMKDCGNHVLLSNMLAAAGRWEEVTLVRDKMKAVGIKKSMGCSWIMVKNVVNVFHAKDTSHIRSSDIQAMLTNLRTTMVASGYAPNTNFALDCLEDEKVISSEDIQDGQGLLARN